MKIEYDCGCIVEYRMASHASCQISEASNKRRTQAKKGRPLKSQGKLIGGGKGQIPVQCTWVIPCTLHIE